MGATPCGVFYMRPGGTAFSERSPRRPVAGPDPPVSESSSRCVPGVTKRGRDGRPRRNETPHPPGVGGGFQMITEGGVSRDR